MGDADPAGLPQLTLHEIPPSGQGLAALIGLGILERFDLEAMGRDSADFYHVTIEAMKLAFADLHRHVVRPGQHAACRRRRCSTRPTWPNAPR